LKSTTPKLVRGGALAYIIPQRILRLPEIARYLASQCKKLFLQGRPVYPLDTHYSQTWQHLPDYGAYQAALTTNPRRVATGLDLVSLKTLGSMT